MTSHAKAMADFLRVQITDEGIGQALMVLVRMARDGDAEAGRLVHEAVKWLLEG